MFKYKEKMASTTIFRVQSTAEKSTTFHAVFK